MRGGPRTYRKVNRAVRGDHAAIVFDLKAQGLSYRAIDVLTQAADGPTGGKRISATTCKELVYEEAARRIDPRVDEYRTIALAGLEAGLERLHNMEESVRRVMAREHITVNNGRVIRLRNDETGAEEPVADDTFILQAVDRLNRLEESRRKTNESIRKLLGLDAPAKLDATVTEVTQQDIELQEMVAELRAKNANTEAELHGGPEHPE